MEPIKTEIVEESEMQGNIEELTILQQELSEKSDEIQELKTKLAEYEDMIKRTQADFENYRKRTIKERDDVIGLANEKLLRELLLIVDSFEKALEVYRTEEAKDGEGDSLFKSLVMMEKQLQDVLSKQGVEPIPAVGKEFDPQYHIAMMMDEHPHETYSVDTVTNEFQKGYIIRNKVLRHTSVVVAKANASQDASSKE